MQHVGLRSTSPSIKGATIPAVTRLLSPPVTKSRLVADGGESAPIFSCFLQPASLPLAHSSPMPLIGHTVKITDIGCLEDSAIFHFPF